MDALYGHSCSRCGGFSNAAEHRINFSPEALNNGLLSIFSGFDVKNDIQQDIFKETLRLFNQAAAKGISQNYDEKAITDEFLEQIRHNNEIFSVFRTHKMQNDIAKQLLNGNGQLKSYDQFRRDVAPLTGKYCEQWLNAEYNTAVIRAHRAADWKHFEAEKDVYPNLMWMPTTSVTPDPVHQSYWERQLTLPVDDPFWGHHHPGERWGCKCTCEQTDAPVNDPTGVSGSSGERTSSKGLAGNPAQTGKLFSEDHPYFPENCGSCPFNKGVRNRLGVFLNKKKDCSSCKACSKMIIQAKSQNGGPNEYYTEAKYGERMKICKGADQSELEDNKRALGSLLDSFPGMEAVIRKHVLEYRVKNPEYLINGKVADRKGIMSEDGIAAAFNKALKQGCKAIVLDLDKNMSDRQLQTKKIAKKLLDRLDFTEDAISDCYVIYRNKSVCISYSDKEEEKIIRLLETIKAEP